MARQFNVSRPIVRRALQQLGDHGLLVRRRGTGTRVVPIRVHRPNQLQTVFDQMESEGRKSITEVFLRGSSPAPNEIAAKLELPAGTDIFTIRRLRLCEQQPVGLMFDVIRAAIVPAAAVLERGSFEPVLAERGVIVAQVRQTFPAYKAATPESQLLWIPVESPILTVQNVFLDDTGHVTAYGEYLFRPDRLAFECTNLAR